MDVHKPFIPAPATTVPDTTRHGRMSVRSRVLFFAVAWAIVLMPFLFWRSTWFGRPLSDRELDQYLHDAEKPRHIQHALVQIGERLARHDAGAARWYPEVIRLASSPVEEIRNTDAWIMGQDTSRPEFHQALLGLLKDPSLMVRSNAALSLVRFGDPSGRRQLVETLQPAHVFAPQAGRITDAGKPGTAVRQGGVVAKLSTSGGEVEARSPIPGRIRSFTVARGTEVQTGAELALVDASSDAVWEALRALYLVGEKEDLPAIAPYNNDLPDMPDRIRQQAVLTEKAILERSRQPDSR